MKIRFNIGYYSKETEFKIANIHYECDEKGPIDIIIYSSEKTLQKIRELVQSGSNIQEIDTYPKSSKMKNFNATHECLFARLPEFTIL